MFSFNFFNFTRSSCHEKPPLIIIDLTYYLCGISTNSRMEQLCGGRAHHFLHNFESFLGRLREQVGELVFFSNAYTKDEDFEIWSKRANERYEKEISVLDLIYQDESLENITQFCLANKIYVALHKLIHPIIWDIARRNGRVIKTYDITRSAASYAKEHGAMAIIGNSSDYLIFDGDWRYWNSRKLNMREMKVLEIDKEAMRAHFLLNIGQMPIFATILGNHIVDTSALEKFHSLLPTEKPLVSAVAHYIHISTDEIPDNEDLEAVTTIAFKQHYDRATVQKSIEYYQAVRRFFSFFFSFQFFNIFFFKSHHTSRKTPLLTENCSINFFTKTISSATKSSTTNSSTHLYNLSIYVKMISRHIRNSF